jgi:hypothetical protein
VRNKYTPGPWVADAAMVLMSDGGAVRVEKYMVDNRHANAALIAAAPDLLEAADALLDVMAREELEAPSESLDRVKAINALYTALRKAKGE